MMSQPLFLALYILQILRVSRLWAPPATQHTHPCHGCSGWLFFSQLSGSLSLPFERTTICTCDIGFRHFSKERKCFRYVSSPFCSYPESHLSFFLYPPRGPFKTIVILLQIDEVAGNQIKETFVFNSTRQREVGDDH